MELTGTVDTGACWNCLAAGAEKCMIVGKKAPDQPGWPTFVAELCAPCKGIALAMSREPGALTPPPWEPSSPAGPAAGRECAQ